MAEEKTVPTEPNSDLFAQLEEKFKKLEKEKRYLEETLDIIRDTLGKETAYSNGSQEVRMLKCADFLEKKYGPNVRRSERKDENNNFAMQICIKKNLNGATVELLYDGRELHVSVTRTPQWGCLPGCLLVPLAVLNLLMARLGFSETLADKVRQDVLNFFANH